MRELCSNSCINFVRPNPCLSPSVLQTRSTFLIFTSGRDDSSVRITVRMLCLSVDQNHRVSDWYQRVTSVYTTEDGKHWATHWRYQPDLFWVSTDTVFSSFALSPLGSFNSMEPNRRFLKSQLLIWGFAFPLVANPLYGYSIVRFILSVPVCSYFRGNDNRLLFYVLLLPIPCFARA